MCKKINPKSKGTDVIKAHPEVIAKNISSTKLHTVVYRSTSYRLGKSEGLMLEKPLEKKKSAIGQVERRFF